METSPSSSSTRGHLGLRSSGNQAAQALIDTMACCGLCVVVLVTLALKACRAITWISCGWMGHQLALRVMATETFSSATSSPEFQEMLHFLVSYGRFVLGVEIARLSCEIVVMFGGLFKTQLIEAFSTTGLVVSLLTSLFGHLVFFYSGLSIFWRFSFDDLDKNSAEKPPLQILLFFTFEILWALLSICMTCLFIHSTVKQVRKEQQTSE